MKSVLITGASTGIGEACARQLDSAGYRVFAGVRRAEDGERLRAGASPRMVPVIVDVADASSIERARLEVTNTLGNAGLDALVNNAGIAVAGPLELLPLDALRHQLEVNVIGQIAVTQAFLPLIRRATGRVVLMGSISGRMATPFLAPYCASKFALEAVADALRLELAPWKIHVALIEPGSIATPIWTKSLEAAERLRAEFRVVEGADYTAALDAMRGMAIESGRRGVPAALVADAVTHAIESRSPKTRYLIGREARIGTWLARLLPDRLRDRLIRRAMKLP